ncbi:MAG: hypothetical protein WC661_21355 [Opitutaceae bacterium]
MIFDTPLPFLEALAAKKVKTLLPTELRTKDLAGLGSALLDRSSFSAGVQSAELLQRFDDLTGQRLDGTLDRASARQALKEFLGSLGDPSVDNTDLTDIRSDARLNLKLDHDLATLQGYGHAVQSNVPEVLDQWPAQELVDTNPSQTENRRDWKAIWTAHGGEFYGDRMIALKSDPIWRAISRFNRPTPPFDFGSYWDVQDVDRATAEDIGLIAPDAEAKPMALEDLNADLQATPEVRADWLRSELAGRLQGIAAFDADGVLKFTGGKAA